MDQPFTCVYPRMFRHSVWRHSDLYTSQLSTTDRTPRPLCDRGPLYFQRLTFVITATHLIASIRRRRLRYLGHILRMDPSRLRISVSSGAIKPGSTACSYRGWDLHAISTASSKIGARVYVEHYQRT
ncbi:uncharacterized protein LOC118406344 [Branchiostoma floridae]|uniref:Uncharacterized protein LOC118406344 n=1 Tax=Branchiostoma floridae TaxID=7739 RepID=A0A9J7KJC5_BRAFL|nr:uncharacterized protein LOC118406344 [Branchiostoma floridae]